MKRPHHSHSKTGFTLIEILVVMTIIGTLAGLMYSGVLAALNAAKRARTTNACHQVKVSISSYYADYRRYPLPDDFDTPYHDSATNEELMNILLGFDKKKNPRGTSYYSGRAARRFGKGKYINGVHIDSDGDSTLWDDYGQLFGVRLDASSTNQLPNPSVDRPNIGGRDAPDWGHPENTIGLSAILTESVLVWSAGKEKDIASDNLKTWE